MKTRECAAGHRFLFRFRRRGASSPWIWPGLARLVFTSCTCPLRHRTGTRPTGLPRWCDELGRAWGSTCDCFRSGHPGNIRHAREKEASLIVLGTHGRTGVSRALLGSVAEPVRRLAGRPVLTVPPMPVASAPADMAAEEPIPDHCVVCVREARRADLRVVPRSIRLGLGESRGRALRPPRDAG